ncbi:MAG: hypothetical protein IKH26_09415, partial [Bacteroidaceae bacterium]|nr:hypothetical protein [Bacteroidaceae bacterium]
HTNKYAHNRRPSKYNLIGSPAIEAKCRTVIEMRTDPFQRNYKHLSVVKGNYTPDSEKNRSYMLEFSPQLTFKNTSRRVDIDTLTLMPDYMADRMEKYNRLRSEGLKGDELAKAMGFASRGSLSVWAKKYIKNPQPTPSQPSPDPKDPKAPNNPNDSNAFSDSQPSDSQSSNSQPSPALKAPKDSQSSNSQSSPDLKAPKDSKDSQPSPSQPSPDLKDPKNPKDSKDSKLPKVSNALSDSEPSDSEPSDSQPSDSELSDSESSPSPSNTSTYPRRPRYNLVDILYSD